MFGQILAGKATRWAGCFRAMRFFVVKCIRSDEDEGSRIAVALAASAFEAVAVCRSAYVASGYSDFIIHSVVDGDVAGPAQIIGHVDASSEARPN
jgi:hypothetical protein